MDKKKHLEGEIVYSEDLIQDLGAASSEKDRANALRLAAEQLSSSSQDGDDWDDTLALRSFLNLPKEAKRRLTKTGSSSSPTTIYGKDQAYSQEDDTGMKKSEPAIKVLTDKYDLDGATLDGTEWYQDENLADVKTLMEKSEQAGVSTGSLSIDLHANSALTMEAIEGHNGAELSGFYDDFQKKSEVASISDQDSLSEKEFESFGQSNASFLRRTAEINTRSSNIAQADFIAQRALLKKVAKEQVFVAEELEKKRKEVGELMKYHIIKGVIRTMRLTQTRFRAEMVHKGWRQWRVFTESFDHVQIGYLEGKYTMAVMALHRSKCKRHVREWRLVVRRSQHRNAYFISQLDKLSTRIIRDAMSSWRITASEMKNNRTEFNFVVVSLRKRLQKMKGINTDLRWAWTRWGMVVRDYRYRDAKIERALVIFARKASTPSWAIRRWRAKTMTYPVERRVRLEEATACLEMLLRKHSYHKLRQRELRCFRIWASKVAQYNSIHEHTYSVLTSLSASAVRRITHARLLHWSRTVKLMKFKATRLYSVIKLAAIAQRRLLQQKALTRWSQTALFEYKIERGLDREDRASRALLETKQKAAAILLRSHVTAMEDRAVIATFVAWKRRNFHVSAQRTRRALVLSALRRCRLEASLKAHAISKWRAIVLATELMVRCLHKLPSLLHKLFMKMKFRAWHDRVRREAALCRMGRWLVNARRIYRLVDTRLCFFRWRTQIRKEIHAECVLMALFERFPRVVYRLTLRRWSTKVSRMKSLKARKEAISTPFYHWCGYVRYWLATKARLQYVVAMARKGAMVFTLQVWTARTKYMARAQKGLTRCVELRSEILILFKRKAFSFWRRINAEHRCNTIVRLTSNLNLALKRVVSGEESHENTVAINSRLQTRIDTLKQYQAFLLHERGPSAKLADKALDRRRMNSTFHAWCRFRSLRKLHSIIVRSLLRNRRRVQVMHILARRFRRWKQLTEFSMVASITTRHANVRYIVCARRARLSLLGWCFRKWSKRSNRFCTQFLPALRRLTRQRCRKRLANAWMRWGRHVMAAAMVEGNLHRCISLRRNFFAWHRYCLTLRFKRTAAHQQALRLIRLKRRDKKAAVLGRWKLKARACGRLRSHLTKLCIFSRRLALLATFQYWRRTVHFIEKYEGLVSCLGAMFRARQRLALTSSFFRWKTTTLQSIGDGLLRRHRETVLRKLAKWYHRSVPLMLSFHHWRRVSAETSRHLFIIEGQLYHDIETRTRRQMLKHHFEAWLHSPRMQRAMPIRAHKAGAGLSAVQDAMESVHNFLHDLYGEVASDRSPSATLKLVTAALSEALPTYLPSVYLLTGSGDTLSGLVSCHHDDTVLGEDVAIEAPAHISPISESESESRSPLYPHRGGVGAAGAPPVFHKAHSLRLGQGRVGRCAQSGLCSAYVDHASHPTIYTPNRRSGHRQEKDADNSSDESDDAEEEVDGEIDVGVKRVVMSNSSTVQLFSSDEPPTATLDRHSRAVVSKSVNTPPPPAKSPHTKLTSPRNAPPPPPSTPLSQQKQGLVTSLLRRHSPHAHKAKHLHRNSPSVTVHTATALHRKKLKSHVGSPKGKSVITKSRALKSPRKPVVEQAEPDKERVEAVLFPLVRHNRVVGVVCLNHRMLHLDKHGAIEDDGEWLSEPPSAARKYKLDHRAQKSQAEAGRRRSAAGACGGERLRSILTFVSSHLGLTLQQSSTLSAMLFSTVDVLASYFPVASKRARPHALHDHSRVRPGTESEASESEFEAEEPPRSGALHESKREAVAKVRALMENQRSQLEANLTTAHEHREHLSKQLEMEQRHSTRIEEKCLELEGHLKQSTSHNLRTITERDHYKLRAEELELHVQEVEKEHEGEVERLRQALDVREREAAEQLSMLGRARSSLQEAQNTSKKEKEEKQESLEAMNRLHSALKAATQALDSDCENEVPDFALDSGAEELLSRMMV